MQNQRLKVGDELNFGTFRGQKIRWEVLKVQDNMALIISSELLCKMPYHQPYENITWSECTLRKWLNNDFINSSFTPAEQSRILQSNLNNDDNESGKPGGVSTIDKIFLLSLKEAEQLFDCDQSRNTGFWCWLRSHGYSSGSAAIITDKGRVDIGGIGVESELGVRPALWLNCNICMSCGQILPANAKFCSKCGAPQDNLPQPELTNSETKSLCPKVGDEFEFGSFNGKQILWKTIRIKDRKALIISSSIICRAPYQQPARQYMTWSECSLRTWLNNEFLNNSFNPRERRRIVQYKLNNDNNPDYYTAGGDITTDSIFLLSIYEATAFFANNQDRSIGDSWWLRSPGFSPSDAAYIDSDGRISINGSDNENINGVRPALWLSINC